MTAAYMAIDQADEALESAIGAIENTSATSGAGLPANLADPQECARAWLNGIRARPTIFDMQLCEGAWIILLDLYANAGKKPVSVTSACIASGYPISTALRWIKELVEAQLIARIADRSDGRRYYLELTQRANAAIISYLQSWPLHRAR